MASGKESGISWLSDNFKNLLLSSMLRKFSFWEKTKLFLFHFLRQIFNFLLFIPKKQAYLPCVLKKPRVSCYIPLLGKQKYQVTKSARRAKLGTLRKTRRRRQRERYQTKGLMSKTMAVHVRYNSLYLSLPSSVKQQREMTKFCVVWRTWTTTANFSSFYLELNAFVAYSARANFNTDRHTG